jgi:hypothetical protein
MPSAHRKLLAYGALLVVTAAAVGSAMAADTATPLPVPAKGCATFTDPADDATPYNFGAPFPAGPMDPDLDITSVVLASPPGKLRAYIKVAELGEPQFGIGHTFSLSFLLNGKRAAFFGGEDPAPIDAAHDGAAGPGFLVRPLTGVSYDGAVVSGATTEAVFDAAASTVVLTTDRAGIEKAAGIDKSAAASLADGAALTEVIAESAYDQVISTTVGDTATSKSYTVGDNACFAPPAAKLTLTGPARAVAGHTVVFGGALTDLAGKASATRTVGISLGRLKTAVTTAPTGAYRTAVPLELSAGTYTVNGVWAGDPTLAPAKAAARIVVSAQPTRAALAGTAGQLSVVLTDDLRHPLAGKTITWSSDGKAVRTSRTDAKGRATFSTAPGHTIKAAYAGDRVRYLGSSAGKRV